LALRERRDYKRLRAGHILNRPRKTRARATAISEDALMMIE